MSYDYVLFDGIISDTAEEELRTLLSKSEVNTTNLYASVYGLFLVHSEDKEVPNKDRKIFKKALSLYDDITPETLYDLMEGDVSTYEYDATSMIKYAQNVINHFELDEEK